MREKWNIRLREKPWGWVLLLIVCAVLPYANTVLNGFVYDDTSQVLENQYVRSFRYLRQIFGSSVFSFTGAPSRYYRPMMTFGYLLSYKVFGLSPAGFHLVNIGLHAGIVCLLFFVTMRMFGDRMLAGGAALLFALHPIHTESVAWIAGVTDLELTFFYLLTFWFFLMLDGAGGKRLGLVYLAMMGSFALATLSKEQAVTLPFLATVFEHFYRADRGSTNWKRKVARYAPLWFLAAAYIPLRLSSLGGFVVTSNHWGLTWREILLAGIALIGQYVGKLLWPVNLCAFYVFEKSTSLLDPRVWVGGFCAILLAAGFVWLWKRAGMVSFGLIWMMVTLAPTLNPRWLGANVFAERYLYLPSAGFCWVAVWGLLGLWKACSRNMVRRRALIAVLSGIALLCTFRIVTRNRDWHDDVTLYTQTLQVSQDASLIQVNLGAAYESQGLLHEAEQEYRSVLEREPECAKCLNSLAWLLIDQSRHAEAKPLLTKAVSIDPRAVAPHLNLAIVYQKEGRMDLAEEQLRIALGVAPGNFYVHTTLATFYEQKGDASQAEAAFKRALSINPYSAQARLSLAGLYEANRRPADAVHEFQTVLQDEPGNVDAVAALQRLQASQTP